jgi:REP element-mobilizing transposase RayT
MVLSDFGKIADQLWTEIPRHFSFTDLDENIIMADHIHGIIIIKYQFSQIDDGIFVDPLHATGQQKPATGLQKPATGLQKPATGLQKPAPGLPKNEHMAHISPKNGSLASIIRSYKSVVSKCIHSTDPGFEWQPRFHDHIIRTNIELIRIRNYIIRNPEKWK